MSIAKITSLIDDVYMNPYPKDLFKWDNKEKFEMTRGRLNELLHKTVENTKKDIINILNQEED
jgi:hypothetical protein